MSLRILLVDDDSSVRRLLRATLPAEGFDVVEAAGGEEALALAAEAAPDLVLLDWAMPGLSGGDVLRRLKSEHRGVPVIILTAKHEPSYRAEAESLGADTFLTKPFSPLELLATVERLLERPLV